MSGPRLKTTAILLVVALLAIGAALYQFAAARAVRADLTAQLTRLEELEAKRAGLQEQLAAAQQRVAAAARDRTSAGAVVQESLARVEVQTAEQKEPPPTGEAIFEITRFCLDRRLRASGRREARDALVTALAEFALEKRIDTYTAIAEMGWFQQILAFGWRCTPLGLPQIADGKLLAALRIDIDAATPGRLAAAGIVACPSLLANTARVAA